MSDDPNLAAVERAIAARDTPEARQWGTLLLRLAPAFTSGELETYALELADTVGRICGDECSPETRQRTALAVHAFVSATGIAVGSIFNQFGLEQTKALKLIGEALVSTGNAGPVVGEEA